MMRSILAPRKALLAVFCLAAAAAPSRATATTVTFDAGSGIALSYTEAGITVTPDVSGFYLTLGDNDGNSSPDLLNHPGCCSTPYRFTYSGGVFSLGKFDFVLNSGTHTFTSSLGAVVTPSSSGVVTLPASGWTGITNFTWHAPGTVVGETAIMDNLKFCPGDCNDGNGCTDDACDPDAGGADVNGCTHTANSAPCSDGMFCNGADTCSGGSCTLHAGDPCTGGAECANVCNEASDNCFVTAGTSCTDDGNVCTNDQCNGSGSCAHPNNSAPCTDGTFCNGADTCSGGSCSLHAGDPCTGGGECANLCNEGAQNCFRPNGVPCSSDGNVCTDDQCNGSGACGHPNNSAPCNDGSVCTTGDQCSGGTCGGTTVSCNDSNPCTIDSCDSMTGCHHDSAPLEGQPCDDNNSCTDGDTCTGGTCSGTPLPQNCDDGNPCTLDSCNPLGGCVHDAAARDGFICDDTNTCTNADVCQGGVCHGTLSEADTDNDGFCDRVENAAGCNPNDPFEIPPRSNAYAGAPGIGPGEGMLNYNTPAMERVPRATDPSCASPGVCGPIGFCTVGRVGDPCAVDSECDLPTNTCRVVINFATVPDLTFNFAKVGRNSIPGFTPMTPGCSRKVDVPLDPARRTNTLKLKATGTVGGHLRRDRDRFRFQNF
jgi:hypothetical protein